MLRLLQRICWNNRGWQFPSGSTEEGGFPGERGFGHEEWNFQLSDTWNGFIFPYTYSVAQRADGENLPVILSTGGKISANFHLRS